MKAIKNLLLVFWFGLAGLVGVAYVERVLLPAWQRVREAGWEEASSVLVFAEALLGLVLLIALLLVLRHVVRTLPSVATARETPTEGAEPVQAHFPAPITLVVGAWVLATAMLALAALLMCLQLTDKGTVRNALVTMFAAGVGSSIATILGYLKHASEKKDFDPAYAAWYIGRPVIGLLLGALFYFVMASGLVVVLPGVQERELNELGLVAIGGLVGLFSKNAVEKLREIFNLLFQTRERTERDLLGRLPPDLKKQVTPYLQVGCDAAGDAHDGAKGTDGGGNR